MNKEKQSEIRIKIKLNNSLLPCSHIGIHQWLLNYTFYCHMGDFNETDQTLHLNQKNRRGKKHTLINESMLNGSSFCITSGGIVVVIVVVGGNVVVVCMALNLSTIQKRLEVIFEFPN
jgi:hypothetical protein